MGTWSFDILRQGAWDWWAWVCLLVTFMFVAYVVVSRAYTGPGARLTMVLVALATFGTLVVLFFGRAASPLAGLVWTLLLLCIASSVFYLNLLPQIGSRRTAVLLLMRCAALVLLVPMLFEPVVRYVSRSEPQRPVIFLIDTSGSMSIPDAQNGPTRVQSVWQALRPQLPRIGERFVPSYFTFASSSTPLDTPEKLATTPAEGVATDLVNAVSKALASSARDDAAVVLISDGIDNVSPNVIDALRLSRRPIHTVSVGSASASPASVTNVAVEAIDAPDDFAVGSKAVFRATIRSSALANRVVDVKLTEIESTDSDAPLPAPLTSERLVLQPLPDGQTVELTYEPKSPGVKRMAIWVDPIPGERTLADNRQDVQGLALEERIKVLYIEGRARPEYRELNRALARDPNIEVASLLRIQGDRFAASGSVGGEPLTELPRTSEAWNRFDVILIGDLDSSFLTKLQRDQIERRTSDGAGFIMIGGQNSLGPGGYAQTPIENALPVMLGDLSAQQEKTPFVPRLTNDGLTHPAMQDLLAWFGSEDYKAENELPALRGNVVVASVKPGAQVLLVHPHRNGPDGSPQVILATQRYGNGRAAVFTADTTYLWYLPLRGMGQDSPYNRFWGQLVRWLAGADVRNRDGGPGIEGLLGKSVYRLGESVRVRSMVRDDKGDATRFAQVSAIVTPRDDRTNEPLQLPLNPSDSRNGLYDVSVGNLSPGEYDIELIAIKDGKQLGKSTLSFTVIPPADELLNLASNAPLLAEIAQATRGFHYPLAQFPQLIDTLLRQDQTSLVSQRTVPLHNSVRTALAIIGVETTWANRYDLPTQALLVGTLLVGEWVLRRRWQLM